MALSKNIVEKNNFGTDSEFDNAYIKIGKITASKDVGVLSVEFRTKKDGNLIKTVGYRFSPDIHGDNLFTQGYLALKELDYLKDAIDC